MGKSKNNDKKPIIRFRTATMPDDVYEHLMKQINEKGITIKEYFVELIEREMKENTTSRKLEEVEQNLLENITKMKDELESHIDRKLKDRLYISNSPPLKDSRRESDENGEPDKPMQKILDINDKTTGTLDESDITPDF